MDEKSGSDSTTKAKAKSASNEESLPISTSSSWTILPADRIEILESTSSNRSEERASGADEQTNERCQLVEDPDAQAEDVSDGISIISDCESTGRISPHPFLREHLNELGFKYDAGLEPPNLASLLDSGEHQQHQEQQHQQQQQQIRERRHAALEPNGVDEAVVRSRSELSQAGGVARRLPALVQSGITAVFYVGATLAILAFIGRLRNPEWQVLGGEKPMAQLEQRIVELELQNNLMRAEIDIMSKQLQYLSQKQGLGQGQGQREGPGRKAKTFKAWPGNGNNVDPIDITKQDLKRPYKCPDGKYVEIAGMCMESQPHAESLADEIGNVVNDVLQQSQAFQQFEKVTERLGTIAGQAHDEPPASDPTKAFHAHGHKTDASQERYTARHKHKRPDQSNEHDSKEQRSGRKRADKSGEQWGRQQRQHQQHRHVSDDSGSGEWHERLMQHREHARQRHELKRNNNWYIERGDSREQKRSGETRR